MTKLETICLEMLETSRKQLRDGEMPPSLLLAESMKPGPTLAVPLEQYPHRAWPVMAQVLIQCCNEKLGGLNWIAHVSCGYVVHRSWDEMAAADFKPKPPAECEDRKAALIVEAKDNDTWAIFSQVCHLHEDGGVDFDAPVNLSGYEGAYSRVLGIGKKPTKEDLAAMREERTP